jgi:hypothetical protein
LKIGPTRFSASIFHASAIKDCRKHGQEKMLSRIESALLVMRDYIVPARMTGGKELWAVAQQN